MFSGDYIEYEDFIVGGDVDFDWIMLEDEWESLVLNYILGIMGCFKGVVYYYCGVYFMIMGIVVFWCLILYLVYLMIVLLFYCNGWNYIWMMLVLGGIVVCCCDIIVKNVFDVIVDEGVIYMGGVLIVLNVLVNLFVEDCCDFDYVVEIYIVGVFFVFVIFVKIEEFGFNIIYVYGLIEIYGYVIECYWKGGDWDDMSIVEVVVCKS